MSTGILAQRYYEHCTPIQCVKGDPKNVQPIPFHSALENTTHSVLTVKNPTELDSPTSGPLHVKIFNGFDGTSIIFKMNSTDTIGKLKQKFGSTLDLIYNGKPVEAHQTLAELHVKHGATLITFQKCHGG